MSLNANQFTEMVLQAMYEMEFLPAIEVEKVESYTGQTTPTGLATAGVVKNLISVHP